MKKSLKKIGNANPVMTQRFGADPYAMVYEDRVYLYMTGDDFIYDETGEIKANMPRCPDSTLCNPVVCRGSHKTLLLCHLFSRWRKGRSSLSS